MTEVPQYTQNIIIMSPIPIVLLKDEQKERIRRRQDSSFWARWTFSFFEDYLRIGNKRELKVEDFPIIEDDDNAETMAAAIHFHYNKEKSMAKALWKVYGLRYMEAAPMFFVEFLLQLTSGWFLARLLNAITDSNETKYIYWYASGLVFDQIAYAFIHHSEWWITVRTGMQIRVGLISAIYKKVTNLSLANVSSTGFVVNLVSNDVQRFEDCSIFLHYIWVTPLQVVGYMTLIYYEIGWSMFAAVGCICLLVPLQYAFGTYFKKYRKITVDYRDERIKSINDMITGIQIVKLYAWEIPFMAKINEWRKSEMKYIWKGNLLKAINESIFFSSGAIVNAITFILYFLLGGELTPAKIFSTIVYLNVLKLSITNFIPKSFQFVSEAMVSLERLETFFALQEVEIGSESPDKSDPGLALSMRDASFAWKKDDSVGILLELNLQVEKGALVLICGQVGSGKSSLLHSLLHDMILLKGTSKMYCRKVGYVPQTPWILSGTIKDNIIFGLPYDEVRFKNAVHAASLERDFQLFPKGANTFIGERGVTLSGGQRARVSLARAIYSDADILLLDDPLSAVDTKVGRFLFDKCIRGALKEKTVLLVTHQLQFLSGASQIVFMEHGKIQQVGSFQEIINSGSAFADSIKLYSKQQENDMSMDDEATVPVSPPVSEALTREDVQEEEFKSEEVLKGSVSISTYYRYFKEGISTFLLFFLPVLLFSSQILGVLSDFWLSNWSAQTNQSPPIYAIGLGSLAAATLVMSIIRAITFFAVSFNSSRNSFHKMLDSVFNSPMLFFQSNPNGRIMNRFSKDINLMDETLPQVFFDLVQCTILMFSVFVVTAVIIPYALILFPFISYLLIKLRTFFMKTSRQIKRLEAITRSPVYSTIPSTLEGLSVIRAFKAKERFNREFFNYQNDNTRIYFAFVTAGRWLGMRLDALVAILTGIIIFAVLLLRENLSISSASVGLLISYLMQMTGTLQWAVRQSSEVENLMVSVERVLEYAGSLDREEPRDVAHILPKVPSDWPSSGKVVFDNLSLAYPDIQHPGKLGDPVLKSLSLQIPAGTKVGIVGRTGAGKSSLLQALFRLVEPTTKGSVKIDNVSTSDLPLQVLRSKISIIPQEPFCFKGSLRFNLDPFNSFSDEALWSVLEATELKETVRNSPDKLETAVEENGSNWSIGERQLICLARAILRNSNTLVMDEATSSVDLHTDQLLQKSIRNLFKQATILTIAHRLNSVIDFDKILVLDHGAIVEFGSPLELLQKDSMNADAWFSKMVDEMGPAARAELLHFAGKK